MCLTRFVFIFSACCRRHIRKTTFNYLNTGPKFGIMCGTWTFTILVPLHQRRSEEQAHRHLRSIAPVQIFVAIFEVAHSPYISKCWCAHFEAHKKSYNEENIFKYFIELMNNSLIFVVFQLHLCIKLKWIFVALMSVYSCYAVRHT